MREYKSITCDVCGGGPGIYGIAGWVFDLNLIYCFDCHKPKVTELNIEKVSPPKKRNFITNFFYKIKTMLFG